MVHDVQPHNIVTMTIVQNSTSNQDLHAQWAQYFGANERIQHYTQRTAECEATFNSSMKLYCDEQERASALLIECSEVQDQIVALQATLLEKQKQRTVHGVMANHALKRMCDQRQDIETYKGLLDQAKLDIIAFASRMKALATHGTLAHNMAPLGQDLEATSVIPADPRLQDGPASSEKVDGDGDVDSRKRRDRSSSPNAIRQVRIKTEQSMPPKV